MSCLDPASAFEDRGACHSRSAYVLHAGRAQPVHAVVAQASRSRRTIRNFLRDHASGTRPAAPLWIRRLPSVDAGDAALASVDRRGRRSNSIAPIGRISGCRASAARPRRRLALSKALIMAERCGLFVIIALGESILITGATFANLAWSTRNDRCLPGVVCRQRRDVDGLLQYRGRALRAATIATSDDPGALARSGYTYHAYPHRRWHHRGGGRRRTGAAASWRP